MGFLHGEGAYIVFEGGEGSGKSTQAQLLAERIEARLTREPGGTVIGRKIREITHDITNTGLSADTELFLMAADRAQHINELVGPTLAGGRHLVSDRSWISSVAYQGYGRELGADRVKDITKLAIGEFMNHDLTILLDISYEGSLVRIKNRNGATDRFEKEEAEFHRRVLKGYLEIAHDLGAVVIESTDSPDKTARIIRKTVRERLGI